MSAPTVSRETPTETGRGSRAAPRTDIQALRALAVSLVFAYHLWPEHLTGGFIGVDVFFVISGFLISSHLLSKPPTPVADITRFWSRRIKRLLPASLLVLAVTLDRLSPRRPRDPVGEHRPASRRRGALRRELAAGHRFGRLPRRRERADPGPALLVAVGGGAVLLRLAGPDRTAGLVGPAAGPVGGPCSSVSCVIAGRLLSYSVWETATAPAAAYFVTPTRAWEFALGGVLACVVTGTDPDDATTPPVLASDRAGRHVVAAAGWPRSRSRRSSTTRTHTLPQLDGCRCRPPARVAVMAAGLTPAMGSSVGDSRCEECSGWATSRTRSTCGTGR